VPIPFYFATFFYFTTYHALSNAILRRITTGYRADGWRRLYLVSAVFVLSYFTAFMETLTISNYPDYSFEDRFMAYTVGSAFYGIYFLVSFPAFFRLDESPGTELSMYQSVFDACGAGMIVLTLLDVVRLCLQVPLVIGGRAVECKNCTSSPEGGWWVVKA
jgi:cycloeucalenol cycloisomerase